MKHWPSFFVASIPIIGGALFLILFITATAAQQATVQSAPLGVKVNMLMEKAANLERLQLETASELADMNRRLYDQEAQIAALHDQLVDLEKKRAKK